MHAILNGDMNGINGINGIIHGILMVIEVRICVGI